MFFKLLAAFLMMEACIQYAAMEITYSQLEWPQLLGSCVTADCHESKRANIDMECDRNYKVDGKPKNDTIYLKKVKDVAFEKYEVTDENGKATRRTYVINQFKGITKFSSYEPEGTPHEICCATKERKTNTAEKEQLKQFCNEDGMKAVDNSNC